MCLIPSYVDGIQGNKFACYTVMKKIKGKLVKYTIKWGRGL